MTIRTFLNNLTFPYESYDVIVKNNDDYKLLNFNEIIEIANFPFINETLHVHYNKICIIFELSDIYWRRLKEL